MINIQALTVDPDNYPTSISMESDSRTPTPANTFSTDVWAGSILKEKYLLLDLLGEGGMGAVYRAQRQDLGDYVAVKLLHDRYAADRIAVERFRREAQAAAMVRHPNVVAIYDFYAKSADAPTFIVMELIKGLSLRDILKKEGKLSPERALALIYEACDGVAAAHRRNILHRDLKPENLILHLQGADGEREAVKVVDFGIAKLRDLPHGQTLTGTSLRIGTPLYMSPEQLEGEPLSPATDVYSLGLILYEMIAGARPSSASSLEQLLIDRLISEPAPLRQHASVPAGIEQVVMRALYRDPNLRQLNAMELAHELHSAAQSLIITQPLVSSPLSSSDNLERAQAEPRAKPEVEETPSLSTASPAPHRLEFHRSPRTVNAQAASLSLRDISPTESSEAADHKEASEAERVMRFWHVVEHLIPFSLVRATGNTAHEIVYHEDDQMLAWINAEVLTNLRMTPGRAYRYTVYLGVVSVAEANRKLRQVFGGIEPPYVERVVEETCFARFEVDERGRPQLGSLSLAHFPWAVAYLTEGNLRSNLDGSDWNKAFDSYSTVVGREFREYAEFLHIHDYKLDAAGLSLLLGGIIEHCGWQLGDFLALARYVITEAEAEGNEPSGNQTTIEIPRITEPITEQDEEEQLAEPEILNSLFVDELRRVGDAVSQNDIGDALESYLSVQKQEGRIDFLSESGRGELKLWLSPKRLPLGRWPSDEAKTLSLIQQAAVNIAAARLDETPVFSVNGPPGTGKTTLLRDLIAAIVVERATCLAEFERPSAAFSSAGTVTRLDNEKSFPVYKPHERITGFEIIVASSNNGAVENVTREIPSRSAIHESYRATASYFTRVAQKVKDPGREAPWGLMAAVLGNMRNRRAFANRFWAFAEDETLDGEANQSPISMRGYLFSKSDTVDDLARWHQAKERFMRARQDVIGLLDVREKYAVAAAKESSLRQARDEAREESGAAADEVEKAAQAERNAVRELDNARASFNDCVANVESAAQDKPIWLLIALSYLKEIEKVRKYNEKMKKAQEAREKASALLEERKKQHRQAVTRHEEARERLRRAVAAKDTAEREFDLNDEIYRRGRAELGEAFGGEEWWSRGEEQIQENTPWVDTVLNRKRTELFLCALDLHEAFIAAARRQIRYNLGIWSDKALGRRLSFSDRENQLRYLWQTFFLVTPVVSTTFAAVGRMFREIKREAFGWVMIDEAGQATPQAAAGALWRAKRAVVVGDPLQIEPVFTVEDGLAGYLLDHFRLSRYWCPPTSNRRGHSAQELADHVNRFGASVRLEEDSESDMDRWVGCPLRVHRRCLSPMFELANLIAYDGRMINATDHSVEERIFQLGNSRWVHVGGVCTEKQWNPAQGKKVVELLNLIIKESPALPDLYIISPFRIVSIKLKGLLKGPLLKLVAKGACTSAQVNDWIEKSIGTVHTFQGKEASCVIFVLGADKSDSGRGAAEWATRKPNILNVAATRAKDRFYIVGDRELWGQLQYFKNAQELLE